jgi:hypothetical protein
VSEPPLDTAMLLTYALDEMRETTNLLRIADLTRSTSRPWWRKVFFAFARSRAEVSAGFAVQYLGENIDRARDHWREALSLLAGLHLAPHDSSSVVGELLEQLHGAGVDDVLARLRHDAIPHPFADAAAHLTKVIGTIRDCDRVVLGALSQLMLKR